MTEAMVHELVWLLIGIEVIDVVISFVVYRRTLSWQDTWNFFYPLTTGLLCFFIAVGCLIFDRYALAGLYTISTVYRLYRWWHDDYNKRKRKKLLDRMAGVVREVGGKLKVVQPVGS